VTTPHFRALFAVLIVNGVAAAIPATLFLFFAQDRLRLGAYAGAFQIVGGADVVARALTRYLKRGQS